MQEDTEVLGENLRGQVWIENQIHIRLWPDWESNPGRIGERHRNNCCANPPAHFIHICTPLCSDSVFQLIWTGMNDINVEGQFEYTDGTAVDYVDWEIREPDNSGNQDCAALVDHGQMRTAKCSRQFYGVCKCRDCYFQAPEIHAAELCS